VISLNLPKGGDKLSPPFPFSQQVVNILLRNSLWHIIQERYRKRNSRTKFVRLNQIAIQQMQILEGNNDRKLLK